MQIKAPCRFKSLSAAGPREDPGREHPAAGLSPSPEFLDTRLAAATRVGRSEKKKGLSTRDRTQEEEEGKG